MFRYVPKKPWHPGPLMDRPLLWYWPEWVVEEIRERRKRVELDVYMDELIHQENNRLQVDWFKPSLEGVDYSGYTWLGFDRSFEVPDIPVQWRARNREKEHLERVERAELQGLIICKCRWVGDRFIYNVNCPIPEHGSHLGRNYV